MDTPKKVEKSFLANKIKGESDVQSIAFHPDFDTESKNLW